MTWIRLCTVTQFDSLMALRWSLELQRGRSLDTLRVTCLDAPGHTRLHHFPATSGSDRDVALKVTDAVIRSSSLRPEQPVSAGLLDGRDIDGLVDEFLASRAPASTAAVDEEPIGDDSAIVATARRLGMDPRPNAPGSASWQAGCPHTNHTLMIQTSNDQFGCGYCKKRGGPAELERFVLQRRAQHRRPNPPKETQ
jgi:hypothetical protein